MHETTARFVYPVLEVGLRLKRRLGRGAAPAFDREHGRLKELLFAPAPPGPVLGPLPAETGRGGVRHSPADRSAFLGVRYALACWLDELFTRAPEWADRWNERKLEVELYGTNDRAWKFWEQARLAEQMPADDALEVFYLCVRLGFRGSLGEDPARLAEWLTATRDRLSRLPANPTPYDLEPDPTPDVPPRHGERVFERMMRAAGAVLLVAVPVVGFLVAFRAGGR
jgi:type VI secretion system protein ImpK